MSGAEPTARADDAQLPEWADGATPPASVKEMTPPVRSDDAGATGWGDDAAPPAREQRVQPERTSAVADSPDEDVTWRRVHKATPLLDTWKMIVTLIGFLTVRNAQEISEAFRHLHVHASAWMVAGSVGGGLVLTALVLGLYSYVSWRFRAYAVTGQAVYERHGILFRQHRSSRLARVQAVDVTRPLLGRVLGLGRLRVETAGGGDSGLTIGFLRDADLADLRNEILARAAGLDVDADGLAGAGRRAVSVPDGASSALGVSRDDLDATAAAPGVPAGGAAPGGLGSAEASADRRAGGGSRTDCTDEVRGAGGTSGESTGRVPAVRLRIAEAPESVLYRVPTPMLVGSLLRSFSFVLFVLVTLTVIVLGTLMIAGVLGDSARAAGSAFWASLLPGILGWGSWAWNRLAGEYGFTAAASPDGLRLRHGLIETRSQTLPPGRIHAVQLSQPLLWRRRGWWRVIVVVAGYGLGDDDVRKQRWDTILLPVGDRATALRALWLVMPDLGAEDPDALMERLMVGSGSAYGLVTASRRARWFHWITWRRKAVAVTHTGFLVRDGRLVRTVTVVPHERSQSHTLRQGPVARTLGVASVRLDLVLGSFHAEIAGLEAAVAARIWRTEAELARRRRHVEGPEAWLARVVPAAAPLPAEGGAS